MSMEILLDPHLGGDVFECLLLGEDAQPVALLQTGRELGHDLVLSPDHLHDLLVAHHPHGLERHHHPHLLL